MAPALTASTVAIAVDVHPERDWVPNPRGRGGRYVNATTVRIGCFAGHDRTLAGARHRLAGSIAGYAAAHRPLERFELGDLTGIIWCEPDDHQAITWYSQVIGPSSGYTGRGNSATRDEAVGYCRWHLADGWAMTDVYDPERIAHAADWLDSGLTDGRGGRELRRACAWQRAARWAYARQRIDSIADPHRWASDHQHEFTDRYDRPDQQGAAAA